MTIAAISSQPVTSPARIGLGKIHVYTGENKGKTTAALGLLLRAMGQGMRVAMIQFAKGKNEEIGEFKIIKELAGLYPGRCSIQQYGRSEFIYGTPNELDIHLAQEGFEKAKDLVAGGEVDILILDELNVALYFNMLDKLEVLSFINRVKAAGNIEVVITGQKAAPEIIEVADLVTEMRKVKHYYDQGTMARIAIEY